MTGDGATPGFGVLFVCTANVCRSPVAEGLAASWLAERPDLRDGAVLLASAGVEAHPGRPMDQHSLAALQALGGRPPEVPSRAFDPALGERADLILTMSRRQRKLVLLQVPRALRRTFTLREAAALLPLADQEAIAGVSVLHRAREVVARLDEARRFRRSGEDDDIQDPIGHTSAKHRAVAADIADAVQPLMHALFAGAAGSEPGRRAGAFSGDGHPVSG